MSDIDVYVCIYNHAKVGGVWGHAPPLPRKVLEIKCPEIASETILGENQSHIIYMVCRVVHQIFGCPYMHLLSQLTLNFHDRTYYSWQNGR